MRYSNNVLEESFIELHYRFNDDSHTMDAFLQHKCEGKFLLLIKTITKICRANVKIEIEPRLEGGLLNRYRIKDEKIKKKKGTLSDSVKVALLTSVFLAPTTVVVNGINELIKSVISEKMKDSEKENLEKEKLRLEIEKLRLEINADAENVFIDGGKRINDYQVQTVIQDFRNKLVKINKNKTAIGSRLKFYQLVLSYNKVNSVSTQVFHAGYLEKTSDFLIERSELLSIANDMSGIVKNIDSLSESYNENLMQIALLNSKDMKRLPRGKSK